MKLANQESELVSLLKRIPLGYAELNVIRERAEQLRDGTLRSRGEAHLPLMLTTFIFESLCLPGMCTYPQSTQFYTDNLVLVMLLIQFYCLCYFTIILSYKGTEFLNSYASHTIYDYQ